MRAAACTIWEGLNLQNAFDALVQELTNSSSPVKRLKELAEEEFPIHSVSARAETFLHWIVTAKLAIEIKQELADIFLSYHPGYICRENCDRKTALDVAMRWREKRAEARLFIKLEERVGNPPLVRSLQQKQYKLAARYLAAGADLNAVSQEGILPLNVLITAQKADLLSKLHTRGALIFEDKGWQMPFIHAMCEGNREIVTAVFHHIISSKISLPMAVCEWAFRTGGHSYLWQCVAANDLAGARYFVERGGLTAQKVRGLTLLYLAMKKGASNELIQTLLAGGANPNEASVISFKKQGSETPLHFAARRHQRELYHLLQENGAQQMPDSQNRYPLSLLLESTELKPPFLIGFREEYFMAARVIDTFQNNPNENAELAKDLLGHVRFFQVIKSISYQDQVTLLMPQCVPPLSMEHSLQLFLGTMEWDTFVDLHRQGEEDLDPYFEMIKIQYDKLLAHFRNASPPRFR